MKFTEAQLEQAFIELLAAEAIPYLAGNAIERNESEVLIKADLKNYLANQYQTDGITTAEIDSIIRKLEVYPSSDLYESNKAIMKLVADGFILKREDRTQKDLYIQLIDYSNLHPFITPKAEDLPNIAAEEQEAYGKDSNIYKIVNQLEIVGSERRIPDGILYINGLPLVVFEFKSAIREEPNIHEAYVQLTTRYKRDIPELFKYNAFCVISDGVNNKAGSFFASYEFFYAWRKIEGMEKEVDGIDSMYTLIQGMFNPKRLLNIIRNFIYIPDSSKKDEKIVCRYPQYYAANKLFENIKLHQRPDGDGKGGTYFGATGSGKSYTMLYLTRLLMRSVHFSSPTIILITDRTDLDDQLAGQFTNAKGFIGDNNVISVESRNELRELLQGRQSGGVFLTTIHKFTEDTNLLTQRTNVICISDEAHRSQTNLDQKIKVTEKGVVRTFGFAKYLHDSLPNATYVGFTGTPIDSTLDVFGEIIDAYTMTESVRDEITVRIVYEGRAAKVLLDNTKLKEIETYYAQCAEEEANEYQIEESKKATTQMNAIIGDPDRLKAVANDFVKHYEGRIAEGATVGKAMFVCSSRFIAYDLYKEIIALRPEWTEVKAFDEGAALSDKDKKEIKPMDLPVPNEGDFYVYAILCNNDSIYIGQTNNLQERWEAHIKGNGAEWTKQYKPIELFYYEVVKSRTEAVNREKELKSSKGRRFLKKKQIQFPLNDVRQTGRIKMIMTRGKDDPKELYDLVGTKEYRKELDRQFKNEKSNFKIAIVVDMWLTGFDVPFLDTMYIDKPIQQHNLIQTISRVNRKFKGKSKGLVVDYIGIKSQMNKALKKYSDVDGTNIEDISQSVIVVKDQLDLLSKLFHNFDTAPYFTGEPLQQLDCLNKAAEFVQLTQKMELRFMGLVKRLKSAYDICCGSEDFEASERDWVHFYLAIRSIVFKLTKGDAPDTFPMNAKVNEMIKEAIQSEGVEEIFKLGDETESQIDIFDEDYLAKIDKIKLPNTKIKLLQQLLAKAIEEFKKVNKFKGIDFSKKMKSLVEKYNERKPDVLQSEVLEEFTDEIIDLYHALIKEKVSFEDLGIDFEEKAFYDILKDLAHKYDFEYPEDRLLHLAKEVKVVVDDKAKYTDWNQRADIKAELKVDLIILLAENDYPPVDKDEVYKEIFEQAENFKKYNNGQ